MFQADAIGIMNEVYRRCQDVFPGEIKDAYLYGSYARGDFDFESDVDILITINLEPTELPDYRNQIVAIYNDLRLEYDVTVSISIKSYEQFHRYSEVLPFYKNVLDEGIRYPAKIVLPKGS